MARQEALALGRIVHALDRRDHVIRLPHRVVDVCEIPEIPVRIVGIEPHRLLHEFDRPLRLLNIGERVGVFRDDVAVVRIERQCLLVFRDRLVVLSAVELGVTKFGEAARVEPVEFLGAARKRDGRFERFARRDGPRITPVEVMRSGERAVRAAVLGRIFDRLLEQPARMPVRRLVELENQMLAAQH